MTDPIARRRILGPTGRRESAGREGGAPYGNLKKEPRLVIGAGAGRWSVIVLTNSSSSIVAFTVARGLINRFLGVR